MQKPRKSKMLSEKAMHSGVNAAYGKYVKRFLSECKKEASYHPECHGDEEGDEFGEAFVNDQIEFIRQYLGFLLLAGPHEETLGRIKYFLNLQGMLKDEDEIELRFVGGEPDGVYVYVSCLNDIDLDDVHSITGFHTLLSYREGGKKWTKRTAKSFIEEVRSDLEYDGDEVKLKYTLYENLMDITCEIR